MTVINYGTLTISSTIAGTTASATFSGPGLTILTANNTFTGNVTVGLGTLEANGGGTDGTFGPLGNCLTAGGTRTITVAGGAELPGQRQRHGLWLGVPHDRTGHPAGRPGFRQRHEQQ